MGIAAIIGIGTVVVRPGVVSGIGPVVAPITVVIVTPHRAMRAEIGGAWRLLCLLEALSLGRSGRAGSDQRNAGRENG